MTAAPKGGEVGETRSDEARAVLAGLDGELAANAASLGVSLVWSAAERAILDLVADTIDRRTDLQRLYDAATDDAALMVKLSTELRLLETNLARLLKQVKTDMPVPLSTRSAKAQHAARVRWDRA